MLIKQDSNVSRQFSQQQQPQQQPADTTNSQLSRHVFKKHYSSDSQYSNNSCQMLIKQDSNGSKSILSNQDSFISYIEPRMKSSDNDSSHHLNKSDRDTDSFNNSNSSIFKQESYPNVKRGILCKQDTQVSYIENVNSKIMLSNQDVSYIENKRHYLIKQDSVISFAGNCLL